MDEFTKTKIGYTIALLAVAFTIYPLIETNKNVGFVFFDIQITIQNAYFLAVSLLAIAVYFISLQFISTKQIDFFDKASNIAYALSLSIPALYISFWLLVILAGWLSTIITYVSPVFWNFLAGLITGLIGKYIATRINKSLKSKDAESKQEENRRQEIALLSRAEQLIEDAHYDLSLLESGKIIELALRQAITLMTGESKLFSMHNLIQRIQKLHVIPQEDIQKIDEVRILRNNTSHLDTKITKDQAISAVNVAKRLVKTLSYSHDTSGFTWLRIHQADALKALSGNNNELLRTVLQHLWEAWVTRDGAVSGEISIFFEEALINNPEIVVNLFKHNEEQLNAWLEQIDTQMFTDYVGGKKEDLVLLKNKIVSSLENYIEKSKNTENISVASRIKEVIINIEVREID
jgi:HEPN domain-containing protein